MRSRFATLAAIIAVPKLVVLDPGHGGWDMGAEVTTPQGIVREKEVTLSLAHAIADELRRKGVRVVLTRQDDSEVPLTERTAMANRIQADAFISIHMNSFKEHQEGAAEGVETYILNHSSDASTKRLADLENSVLEGSRAGGENGAPNAPDVSLIVKDLLLDGNKKQSQSLACAVQNHVVAATSNDKTRSRKNRGIRQALFYVLLGADMPSILLETGFLDNTRDLSLVTSPSGKQQIARAVADAVTTFRKTEIRNCKFF